MNGTVRMTAAGHVVVRWLAVLLALGLRAGYFAGTLNAQVIDTNQFINHFPMPNAAAPLRPIWGFNDDEYSVGAYMQTDPPIAPNWTRGGEWQLARSLGVKIIEDRGYIGWGPTWDYLADSAVGRDSSGRWNERVIFVTEPLQAPGWGREAIFYPFDSVQWYYWPCLFKNKSGGSSRLNPVMTDHSGGDASEQFYDTSNTSVNEQILSRIVFGYDSVQQVRRYNPIADWDDIQKDSTEVSGDAFWWANDLDLTNRWSNSDHPGVSSHLWFVVTGHLFAPDTTFIPASDTDSLLTLEIWLEVPKAHYWTDAAWTETTGTNHVDGSSTHEILYATRYVRKSDLKPDSLLNYNRYREIAIPVNMIRDSVTGVRGPWYNDTLDRTHRFDLRVRWTGREKLALRSIAIRDTAMQLLMSSTAEGIAFRDTLASAADRVMYGPGAHDADTLARRMGKIIRLGLGDENPSLRWAGFSYLDSMLYRRFHSSRPADSLVKGTRGWHGMADLSYNRCVNTSENEIPVETYLFVRTDPKTDSIFGLPKHLLTFPALPEHNGGRFGGGRWDPVRGMAAGIVPLTIDPSLPHSRDSIENYTKMIQRLQYGEYYHGPIHGQRGGVTVLLGNAAAMSRRTGRRIIHWPGNHIHFDIGWRKVSTGLVIQDSASLFTDTTGQQWTKDIPFPRLPEASELRAMVNLGICYGARGIHWPFIGCNDLTLRDIAFKDNTGRPHYNWGTDWGDIGPRFTDSNDYQRLSDSLFIFYNADSTRRDTVRGLYTGWNTRLRTIRWINRVWLASIGPEMLKLRWRDGYSMHFTVRQPYPLDTGEAHLRQFPSNEVISLIEAWDRWGHKDSAAATYVELGLFDKKTGTTGGLYDPMKDTTHIYLVNRRTFERPDGVSATSARGKLMDSLAETRRLLVTLNLPHPDTTQYNFVHVREIAPDTSRLPGTNVPRAGLDTIVNGDSAVAITLRPGGGALLRITYLPPDSSINAGDLRYNNQRKMIFDGRRYYSCYGRNDSIFFRRSLPVTNESASVLWLPIEECVSCNGDSSRVENRFPSMTLRHLNADTIVSIVWTADPKWGYWPGTADREVLLREYAYGSLSGKTPLYYTRYRNIEHVDLYAGAVDSLWGTPGICREDGGSIIVWSDSVLGIMGRVQRLDPTGRNAILPPSIFSKRDTVVPSVYAAFADQAKYPSVPTFAHIARHDSSCGLVWQSRWLDSSYSVIPYARMVHVRTAAGADSLYASFGVSPIVVSTYDSLNVHPSIDLQQDARRRIQEGVTWEKSYSTMFYDRVKKNYYPMYGRSIYYQSMGADTTTRPYTDALVGVNAEFTVIVDGDLLGRGDGYPAYPNIASTNRSSGPGDPSDSATFAIVVQKFDPANPVMQQATIRYAGSSFFTGWPRTYAWGGEHPNGAASPVKENSRYAALYEQKDTGSGHVLRTSRQFFAKMRPGNYVATGRRVLFRISDSLRTGIRVTLHDVWYAMDSSANSLPLADREISPERTDSVDQVERLLRSRTFHAWDSTMIGCQIEGEYIGDSTAGAGARIDGVVEVVDSSSGAVVAEIDSFTVSATARHHAEIAASTPDLLAGTYYLRLRLSSASFPCDSVPYAGRYPVDELASWVDDTRSLAKLRRIDESAAELTRLTAQPNPFNAGTEIRFTVSRERKVTLRVLDDVGREVARPVDGVWTVPGRYAIDLDGRGLRAGTYLVDLDEGGEHTLSKVVLIR